MKPPFNFLLCCQDGYYKAQNRSTLCSVASQHHGLPLWAQRAAGVVVQATHSRPDGAPQFWRAFLALVAMKPNGVQQRLVGTVIYSFEGQGFKLVGMQMLQVWKGHDMIHISRTMIGHIDSKEAAPGTIREDFTAYRGEFHIAFSFLFK